MRENLTIADLERIEEDFKWARDREELPAWMLWSLPEVFLSYRALAAQISEREKRIAAQSETEEA